MGYGARERRKAKRAIAREFKLPAKEIKAGYILEEEQADNLHKQWEEASAKHASTKSMRMVLAQSAYAIAEKAINGEIARHAADCTARRIRARHA